jgi:hypothetical protein
MGYVFLQMVGGIGDRLIDLRQWCSQHHAVPDRQERRIERA